jgi:hypothetical protein
LRGDYRRRAAEVATNGNGRTEEKVVEIKGGWGRGDCAGGASTAYRGLARTCCLRSLQAAGVAGFPLSRSMA